ncbi:MAG: rRNA maturation RNase YbeY [Kiritimatiellae bacterium]|nr:rRNA maturation RNase YbeY [Kiritimatiellia bacterium]
MQINIENSAYSDCVDEAALISVVHQLAAMAQRDSGCAVPWSEVSVYLLNDDSIAPVHRAIQGVAGTTDVITQRYEPVPGEPEGLTGEIFVNLQCACREGNRRGEEDPTWSVDKELALYIAHGCDHLTDAEDETEEGFQSMRARELRWLDELKLTTLVLKAIE